MECYDLLARSYGYTRDDFFMLEPTTINNLYTMASIAENNEYSKTATFHTDKHKYKPMRYKEISDYNDGDVIDRLLKATDFVSQDSSREVH
jgi:hypothetical protein